MPHKEGTADRRIAIMDERSKSRAEECPSSCDKPEQDIKSEVSEWANDYDIMPVQSDFITDDIHAYVHTRVREDNGLKRWRSQPQVQDEIETRLTEKADGM